MRTYMARYSDLRRLATVGVLIAAGIMALWVVPSGATIVCPAGIKLPSPYCTNLPPTAATLPAAKISGTSARLNGSAGPNVQGGDVTQYFFQYGATTPTALRRRRARSDHARRGSPHRVRLATFRRRSLVSANVENLTPCTNYHFRVVARNPDGSFSGADRAFTTTSAKPLTNVTSPAKVKAGHKFKLQFTVKYDAKVVKIFIEKQNGAIVQAKNYGSLRAGTYKKTLTAAKHTRNYDVEVFAKLGCSQQGVTKSLKVR
jgi:hypothetical protein